MDPAKVDLKTTASPLDLETTTSRIENGDNSGVSPSQREKALVRHIDLILMPPLWVMYLFSYADRTNVGNAYVAGMKADLALSSGQYSLALVLFFIPYVVFQIPSNLILSKTRPSIYLPVVMTLWGAVTCCMAAVQSHEALWAVRFVLGILEASFAPGVSLLLSSWYKREEQAKRFSGFYSAAVLSGAFGGLIAGAVTGSLNNAKGIAGWRWLFIVEGASTMACAIIAAFILPDFPATTQGLSEDERQLAVDRLLATNVSARTEDSEPTSALKAVQDSLRSWRTWLLTIGYMAIGGSGTLSYFYPTLVAGLGYKANKAEYMVIPIYTVAFFAVLSIGFFNDAIPRIRGAMIASCLALAMVCSVAVCAVYNFTARYVLLVFLASGVLSANAASLSYASSTLGAMPQETRAVSLAFINSMANLSPIYGAYLFPSDDSPEYIMAFATISALCATGVVVYSALQVLVQRYPLNPHQFGR